MTRRSSRCVFVLGRYAVGGAQRQLVSLITHRPDRARVLDVHIITLAPTEAPELERRARAAGVHTTLVDRTSRRFPLFFLRLFIEMLRLRPVFVSTFLDSSVGSWGRLAAWLARVPIIVHSDRQQDPHGTRAHFLIRPFLDRVTKRFLPNSHAIAKRLVADGVPCAKIRVVQNGVDLRLFDPTTVSGHRSAWGVAPGETVLGFLGRFAHVKRIDLLLEALRRLPEAVRPDHVVLAGDGDAMPSIRETISGDPWFRQRCRLVGSIDDTAAFLAGIDYLVLSSDSEGLPNVVLEAMAMGKPVVATAVSEVPVMVADTGYVVPPGDADALAGAIASMERLGGDERRELGMRARRRVEEMYGIAVRSAEFWDAHLDLIATAGDGGT